MSHSTKQIKPVAKVYDESSEKIAVIQICGVATG
jgi:hypothetical protein